MKRETLRAGLVGAIVLGAVVFGMVVAGSLGLTVDTFGLNGGQEQATPRFADPVAVDAQHQIASFADLAEAVLPAVVTVRSTSIETTSGSGGLDLFRMFPGRDEPRERQRRGVGSGFVISPDGWLVTNNHVVDGADNVVVVMGDEEFDAEVRGTDPSTDLAVLKVEGENLPHLRIGDSDQLRVGDWVMAVGSPLGFGSSVTVGVVSAKGRVLGITGDRAFDDFIQTDAAINRGNSGGPLVNTRGEVIGVSTAMNYGAENIGFAVSSKVLNDVVPELRGEGRVARGYLGVAIEDLDEDMAEAFGLDSPRGALIQAIQASPARRAGLEAGDVVTRVDGEEIENVEDLIQRISSRRPGDEVELGLVRRGERIDKTVELGDRTEEIGGGMTRPDEPAEPTSLEWLDVRVEALSPAMGQQLRLEPGVEGVLITEVGASSPLTDEGVVDLDIVLEVNRQPVTSVAEFRRAIEEVESGETVLLLVYSPQRGGLRDFVVVRKP